VPQFLAAPGWLGMRLDGQWYCSTRCIEEAVRARVRDLPPVEPAYHQGWRAMRLGSLLMHQVGLPRDVIETAIAGQGPDAVPLGRMLRTLGLVTAEDVLKALATQAGVRYLASVNPRSVAHRPGSLPDDVVRALGIVPISADPKKREMQVACVAPVPGLAVRALTRLTEWAVEPLLVADETMPQLVDLYASSSGSRSSVVGFVCDPLSGPARVAQFAKRRRMVRMVQERCDPYVWVRVDGEGVTADVLMSLPELERGY
jgi:hypothetical protein